MSEPKFDSPDEIITIVRVLEYRGPRQWVQATLDSPHTYVKGKVECGANCTIEEKFVGELLPWNGR